MNQGFLIIVITCIVVFQATSERHGQPSHGCGRGKVRTQQSPGLPQHRYGRSCALASVCCDGLRKR
jgi:hypothetical protein